MIDLAKIDLKKEVAALKKLTYQERGADIKFLVDYVRIKEGQVGLTKVKAILAKIGYQLPNVKKIANLEWISSILPNIFIVASAKVFNWQENDLIELGKKSLTHHFLLRRLFMKYFFSLEKTLKKAAQIWPKQYSQGRIEVVKYDKKDQAITIRLVDFKSHPFTYLFLQGVFTKMIELATDSKKVIGQATKSIFRNDPYQEYLFKWE